MRGGEMAKRNAIIVLGIAVVFAFLAALMAYNWLQKRTTAVTVMKPQLVAVAAADLAWGTSLTDETVKMAPYLVTSLPDGYFLNEAQLKGRTILYPLKKGELILESKLAPASIKGGGIAAIIPSNKRAMAVKVDKVVGVSGFINPGHHVDVLVTLSSDADKFITKIVLENVLVLATGPAVEKTGNKEKPSEVDVVTLEVTPQEAEKLALAATEGKLRLALRNYADKEDVFTRGSTISTLLASYAGPVQATAAVPHKSSKSKRIAPQAAVTQVTPSEPKTFTVEIINGSERREVKFGNGGEE
jgi:pilus assembly protein CpaB